MFDENVSRNRAFGGDAFAASSHNIDLRSLFVGREIRFEIEMFDRVFFVNVDDPAARRKRRASDHILSGGIARRVVETQINEFIRSVSVNVFEFRDA